MARHGSNNGGYGGGGMDLHPAKKTSTPMGMFIVVVIAIAVIALFALANMPVPAA